MLNMKRPMKQVFTEILDECVIVVLGNGTLLLDGVNILTDSTGTNSIVVVNEGTANIVNSSFEKKNFWEDLLLIIWEEFQQKMPQLLQMNFFLQSSKLEWGQA